MSSNSVYLHEMISNLQPLEIRGTITQEALRNAICGQFLVDGKTMLYITNTESDCWIYFENNKAIAAKANGLKGEAALEEILHLDYSAVSATVNVELPEREFSLTLQDFISLLRPEKVEKRKQGLKLHFLEEIPFCKGFAAFEEGTPAVQNEVIVDTLPIEFFRDLLKGSDATGIFTKIKQYNKDEQFFICEYSGYLWVFKFQINAVKDGLREEIYKSLEKACE